MDPHEHCACIQFWRFIVAGNADTSHVLRVWLENTELVSENHRLKRRVRVLEQRLGIRDKTKASA